MSTKSRILEMLEENKGNSVSGEHLAELLNISRASVWKAINQLKQEGYQIQAITNKGYRLSEESDLISPEGIRPFLSDKASHCHIQAYPVLDSTNEEAKRLALKGAPDGTVVITEAQTAGKGRLGRNFVSPKESGVYISLLIRPKMNATDAVLITTMASVAVCRAIQAITGLSPQIKWVNDVYYQNKKICGILTEAITDFETGTIGALILGIGINLTPPREGFPSELEHIVGTLLPQKDTLVTRNRVIGELLNQIYELFEDLQSRSYISEYKERSLLLGKEVNVITFHETYPATVIDISNDGGLIVKTKKNEIQTITSGEVSIRLI